jgi:NAD-dependent SIR2 family protein deacetylase
MSVDRELKRAAEALGSASALLISAGAGMGVDSGLPDFRGNEGFWKAYPPFGKLGLSFVELAQPSWFESDPALAWGFYGHRLALYRRTVPHAGFARLRAWGERCARGSFVFTSNIDGQFQRAGFDHERIVECHGSLAYLQCCNPCSFEIFAAPELDVDVDDETMRAREPLPRCPHCRELARPNVLMFADGEWLSERTDAQQDRLTAWLRQLDADDAFARLVVFECGAGTAIPTVRGLGERLASEGATLIRVNVRASEVPPGQIALPLGAAEATARLEALLGSS